MRPQKIFRILGLFATGAVFGYILHGLVGKDSHTEKTLSGTDSTFVPSRIHRPNTPVLPTESMDSDKPDGSASFGSIVRMPKYWERHEQLLKRLKLADPGDLAELEDILLLAASSKTCLTNGEIDEINRRIGELTGAEGLKRFNPLPPAPIDQAMKMRLLGFASTDGSSALAYISNLPKYQGQHLASALVDGLLEIDVDSAKNAYDKLPSNLQVTSANTLVTGILRSNTPEQAAGIIDGLTTVPNGNRMLAGSPTKEMVAQMELTGSFVRQIASENLGFAQKWIETKADSGLINNIVLKDFASAGVSSLGAVKTMDWALEVAGGHESDLSYSFLLSTAKACVAEDLPGVAQWLLNNPNVRNRHEILNWMAGEIAHVDEEAAIAWREYAKTESDQNFQRIVARAQSDYESWLKSKQPK